jgi:hypothetical protein
MWELNYLPKLFEIISLFQTINEHTCIVLRSSMTSIDTEYGLTILRHIVLVKFAKTSREIILITIAFVSI